MGYLTDYIARCVYTLIGWNNAHFGGSFGFWKIECHRVEMDGAGWLLFWLFMRNMSVRMWEWRRMREKAANIYSLWVQWKSCSDWLEHVMCSFYRYFAFCDCSSLVAGWTERRSTVSALHPVALASRQWIICRLWFRELWDLLQWHRLPPECST